MSEDEAVKVSQEKLKTLRRIRGGHRAYATKLVKESTGLLQNAAVSGDDKIRMENELFTNLKTLEDKRSELKELDGQVASLVEGEKELEDEIVATGDYNRSVLKSIVELERYLGQGKGNKLNSDSSSGHAKTQAKLPKLTLKKYNGDPLQYQTFWDSFESAVHNNAALDDISKFNYLKGLLEGRASLVVQGLLLTSENYQEAIDLLKKRFGDPQLIITSHMDALLALVPVKENKVSELRQLCDVIEIHTRNLQLFDICAQNYGPVLTSIILSKLPTEFKLEISRQMPDGKWDITKLMDVMKREVVSRERCVKEDKLGDDNFSDGLQGSAATLFSQSSQSNSQGRGRHGNKRRNYLCAFCEKPHQSKLCRTVSSVEERKAVVRRKNKCYICLKSNHVARDCYSKQPCRNCRGKHHEAICSQNDQDGGDNNPSENTTVNNPANHVVSSNNLINEGTSKCILLQTAQAEVYDVNCNNKALIRVIFDNCSQRSFLKDSLRRKLKLPTIRLETISVKTFASETERTQNLDVVNFKVRCKDLNSVVIVEAYVVPLICAPVSSQRINMAKENHSMLQGLELADNSDTSTEM